MASVPVRLVVSSIALAIVGVGPVGASGIPPFVLCAKLPAAAVNRWVSGIVGSSSMDTNNGSGTCRYRDDLEPYPDLDGDVTISVSTRDPSNLIVLLAEERRKSGAPAGFRSRNVAGSCAGYACSGELVCVSKKKSVSVRVWRPGSRNQALQVARDAEKAFC